MSEYNSILQEGQFLQFLKGQTYPAKFKLNDGIWVVRYIQDKKMGSKYNLRLASELVGYHIAQMLGVPIPKFKIVMIDKTFERSYGQQKIEIRAGPATATKWIENARYPDLETEPLQKFWKKEYYLQIVARVRVADTWMMNFDRRKRGNVILTCSQENPQVWFIDFDQSFLAKVKSPIYSYRLHWSDRNFKKICLDDTEVLSGFNGTGTIQCESIQRFDHFKNVLARLRKISEEELKAVLEEIPFEWKISQKRTRKWLISFLYCRNITVRNIERRYRDIKRKNKGPLIDE